MADEKMHRQRCSEAFWRAHHEAWNLNQRKYCEAQGIPLKAFGNWRAKFKSEPQAPERKLLYRHRLSHSASHMTDDLSAPPRRSSAPFGQDDKLRIVAEASQLGANLPAVARSYGTAARVLFRWKQELAAAPVFVAVQITDAPAEVRAP
jgi:hypothetical protein